MRRLFSALVLVFLPCTTLALDYSDRSLLYTDAPFSPAEAAGISLLTAVGAVEGNPDGSFRPHRTLNRAEFLKIVLESHPQIRVTPSDAHHCFPDVATGDWFSRYVCLAEKRGVVQGYPDGTFRPENEVNYAEALKMLGELYDYTAYAEPDAEWYAIYAQAAKNHKTELPVSLPYDRPLTRGQMARLAAAYRAEHEGELEDYREAERGKIVMRHVPVSASSASSAASESSAASSASSESSEASESSSEAPVITAAVSQLLRVGTRSEPIATSTFAPRSGPVRVRLVRVELNREVKSLDSMYLLNQYGEEIGEISVDKGDPEKEIWKGSYSEDDAYILSDEELFGVEIRLKSLGNGGISEELVQVKKFSMTVQGVLDGQSYELVSPVRVQPQHQTAYGWLGGITNALASTGSIAAIDDVLLASFTFTGSTVSAAHTRIEHLTFTVDASYGVAISDWKLGTDGEHVRASCSSSDRAEVNCDGIPVNIGALADGVRTVNLYGDLEMGGVEAGRTIQVSLEKAGAIGDIGAVRWTDGTGQFTWVEFSEPLAEGTLWEVLPQ